MTIKTIADACKVKPAIINYYILPEDKKQNCYTESDVSKMLRFVAMEAFQVGQIASSAVDTQAKAIVNQILGEE